MSQGFGMSDTYDDSARQAGRPYVPPRITRRGADQTEGVVLRHAPWLGRIPRNGGATAGYQALKRGMDMALVVLSLPVILPLMAACAVALKLESLRDPVFFVQTRTGRGGHRFPMFKFRTMVTNADELKQRLAERNQLAWPDFKVEDDPRVTSVGRVLRRTSLDELPQLLNVVLGQMSLVGPRPTSFGPETYAEWQRARLGAAPGLTGLWQITGRGTLEFDDRVRLDLAYIERQCLAVDVQILVRTLGAVVTQQGTH